MLHSHICQNCGTEFQAIQRTRKYCCHDCYVQAAMVGNSRAAGHRPNATTFKDGSSPWNKGKRGIHCSPGSEFKKGHYLPTYAVGETSIRGNSKRNDYRRYIKIGEPNEWELYAKHVWESANGPLPDGFVIHHIDGDKLNDSPKNLQAMTRSEHIKIHRPSRRTPIHPICSAVNMSGV